jgi:LytR cell envelope-related transcriptional attenuator
VTEPAPSGGPSPLRVGGLALLGAGAVAALIGLATLLPGGGSTTTPPATTPPPAPTAAPTAAPGATVAAPAPTVPAAVPTVGPTAAVAAPPAAPAPAPAPAAPQAGTGTGGGNAAARGPVRVYNNSTVTGLAARAANDFRADGWQVGQVANYSSGNIPTSTVYYRPGTTEQSAASTIASEFGLRAEPRFSGIDDATPGLIVIVTNDYQKRK